MFGTISLSDCPKFTGMDVRGRTDEIHAIRFEWSVQILDGFGHVSISSQLLLIFAVIDFRARLEDGLESTSF